MSEELYKQKRKQLDKKVAILDEWIGDASKEPDSEDKKAIIQALTSAQRHYNEKRIKLHE